LKKKKQLIPKLQFKNHTIKNRSQSMPFVSTADLKSLVKERENSQGWLQ